MSIHRAMTRRAWLGTSGALLLGAGADVRSAAAQERRVDGDGGSQADDVARWMRLASVPGLSLAMVADGAVETRGYGVRRAGTADAVTADTVFEAASLTKPVFAYLVHTLAGEGVIDLGRPLGEYLPLPNEDDARARTITARHVLSHSGGACGMSIIHRTRTTLVHNRHPRLSVSDYRCG